MAEKEYIERNALLAGKRWLALSAIDRAVAKATILDMPVEAVVEVRQGHWEVTVSENSPQVFRTGPPRCSACERTAPMRTDFCPHCGAKMNNNGRGLRSKIGIIDELAEVEGDA